MPVYMELEGIKGSVKTPAAGGINALMADGSVRFISYSVAKSSAAIGGGPRVTVYNGADRSGASGSGHKFTLGRHFDSPTAIEISRIVMPNSTLGFDRIDSQDGDAGAKARQLFNAAANSGGGLIVSITRAAVRESSKFNCSNNLKQIGLGMHAPAASLGFIVSDLGNSTPVAIELQNAIVSSYQLSGSDGGGLRMESFSINFAQVKCVP